MRYSKTWIEGKGVGDHLLIGDVTPTVGTPTSLYHPDLGVIDD